MKINLNEWDRGDFNGLGTSNNPNDKRTNYKFTDLYIPGNDAAPDELFQQVVNNYITDREELEAIQKILERNGWDEEAKIVGYYIDEIDEEAEYGDAYSISRMKIDIADGYSLAGFEDVPWDSFNLSCYYDSHSNKVVIELTDTDTWETDATAISLDEFMNMTRKEFDNVAAELSFYGNFEPNGGFPEDEE
jgi:hypothetical protein